MKDKWPCQWITGLNMNCLNCKAVKKGCEAMAKFNGHNIQIAYALAKELRKAGQQFNVTIPVNSALRVINSQSCAGVLDLALTMQSPDTEVPAMTAASSTAVVTLNPPNIGSSMGTSQGAVKGRSG